MIFTAQDSDSRVNVNVGVEYMRQRGVVGLGAY